MICCGLSKIDHVYLFMYVYIICILSIFNLYSVMNFTPQRTIMCKIRFFAHAYVCICVYIGVYIYIICVSVLFKSRTLFLHIDARIQTYNIVYSYIHIKELYNPTKKCANAKIIKLSGELSWILRDIKFIFYNRYWWSFMDMDIARMWSLCGGTTHHL